jgi:protein-L-isoaspartate(D-aspartate) O-methyltransferase
MADQPPPDDDGFQRHRSEMVVYQLKRRGISDASVLDAMEQVPRHLFVSLSLRSQAYEDHPLPIGCGQTISQPYMVARMTELCQLEPDDRVLEVGAGSGYQTAILARLCAQVYATELLPELADGARLALEQAGVHNVTLEQRDGSRGWPEHGPYDAILVAAGAPSIPEPLKEQLADGGRLVIPVGGLGLQILEVLIRQGDSWRSKSDTPCRFVNLRGAFGWDN